MRKIIKLFLITICVTLFSSCSFNSFISTLNDKYYENYGLHEDTGYSINTLNNAFNAITDANGESLISEYEEYASLENERLEEINLTKTVSDLSYYEYATPTKGNIKGLVIPVDFSDSQASYTEEEYYPSYQSVKSYYYNSSMGKLNYDFTVLPWFRLKNPSTYYANLKEGYYGDAKGVSAIIHEVLKELEKTMDLSIYDNNNDGMIDCLYIIYNHELDKNFWWAYQYCNFEAISYDGVIPCYYVFAGYAFLKNEFKDCNAKTYIHETGHLLGLQDYYDNDATIGYNKGGLGGADMMDENYGDHNPFSKVSLGWIDKVYLVRLNKKEKISITLDSFALSGQIIMIADNYDYEKEIYQDYFLLDYFDSDSILNYNVGPIYNDGLRVYRIHGELTNYENSSGEQYEYFKYNNSTTDYNLIDAIVYKNFGFLEGVYSQREYNTLIASSQDLFTKGKGKSTLYYNTETTSDYYFVVSGINNKKLTLEIAKK